MAPPISRPNDFEIIENAPPGPTRMFVTNEAIDRLVQPVIAKDIPMMRYAPASPALPTTQPSRKNKMTPKMVNKVGVNTPPKTPYFWDC